MTKQITKKYYNGNQYSHEYTETWEPLSELYCPSCGKQEVWHSTEPGDYYVEEQHMCRSCGDSFYLPGGISQMRNKSPLDVDHQIFTQLNVP